MTLSCMATAATLRRLLCGQTGIAWLLVLLLHMLGFWFVRASTDSAGVRNAADAGRVMQLVWLAPLAPREMVAEPVRTREQQLPASKERSKPAPRATAEPLAKMPKPPAMRDEAVRAPLPAEVSGHDNAITESRLLADSLRAVGAIDRQLRKEFPQLQQSEVKTAQQKFTAAMAAAAVGTAAGVTTQELGVINGASVTRVTTPFGSYCVYQSHVSQSKGQDQWSGRVPAGTTGMCPD